MSDLVEQLKKFIEMKKPDSSYKPLYGDGMADENERLKPVFDALIECAAVLQYACGPTRDVKTPKMQEALATLTEAVAKGLKE